LRAVPPVLVDWIRSTGKVTTSRLGFVPALPSGGGLALVARDDEETRLDITADGIFERHDMSSAWALERPLASARAAAIFRSTLWGGL
jgi:hypothetical protein